MSSTDTRFKPGFDARRGKKRVEVIHGMSISELAQQYSHEAVNLLRCITSNLEINGEPRTDNKKYPTASRVAAATKLLEYAHGKPDSMIKIQAVTPHGRAELANMTTSQLLTIIEAEQAE